MTAPFLLTFDRNPYRDDELDWEWLVVPLRAANDPERWGRARETRSPQEGGNAVERRPLPGPIPGDPR
jgi:hypothetical protein